MSAQGRGIPSTGDRDDTAPRHAVTRPCFVAVGDFNDCRWTAAVIEPMSEAELQAAIDDLEMAMPALRQRHCDLPSYTGAWSDRCDAILAATPDPLRRAVERQLDRIGVRWGAVAGARMTSQFPAYVPPK